ncbi:MAG: hypothetical protein ACOCWI_00890 [Bacillota bacterium]
MAVRVQNQANIRKAKRWNEKDDAALAELLKKKIKEVDLAIKDASSPFVRSKLKAKKSHYKDISVKLENGTYNGDIIFSEMQAAAALRTKDVIKNERFSDPGEGRKYVNSYEDMDFDYEAYFRKTRYYGRFLPILMTFMTIILIAFFLLGAFLPADLSQSVYQSTGLKTDTLFYFKLGPNERDFRIENDGNWPDGDWRVEGGEQQRLTYGEPYVDPDTQETPEHVYLYTDLGMRTVNINAFDIVKAWFRTKMLSSVRIDFLEDNEEFQGPSWFYAKYMDKAEENIAYLRNDDGSFDFSVLFKYIAGYGTILSLIIAFVLAVVCLILNIGRIFSYTTRRLHTLHYLLLIFSLLAVALPAFMAMEGTDIVTAFENYFLFNHVAFIENENNTLTLSPLALVPAGIGLILLILPKIFKNRLKKKPTYIPKGNRPRRNMEHKMDEIAYGNVRRAYQSRR